MDSMNPMDSVDAPTLDDVRSWPATIDVGKACSALGYSKSWGYQLIKQNEFPCKVISVRNRARVVTASLIELLTT